ncbi:UbiA family prenyltransferase [Furfurilactobacillus entadae]|uniref:UbiA family prenyltransferase n=1 Tax=Furfurilactobacillus entadae TaxID=2922307 RepID=UPI0035E994CB
MGTGTKAVVLVEVKMKPKVFLEFVEMQSMVASVLPFILGLLYAWYNFHSFVLINSLLFFVINELLHMAVNANDNLQDFIHAKDEETFKKVTNVVGHYAISKRTGIGVIVTLVTTAAVLGVALLKLTWGPFSWQLILMGLFGCLIGYFYAGGARPISTTPFGEAVSGLTMGYVIMLAAVYVNIAPARQMTWTAAGEILLASGLAVFAISNIMLANNLCDVEEDKLNDRKTIVVLLGQRTMLTVWRVSYGLGYLCVIVAVLMGILPKLALLVLLSAPLIHRNNVAFSAKMIKSQSFVLSVKNSVLLTVSLVLAIGLGIITGI